MKYDDTYFIYDLHIAEILVKEYGYECSEVQSGPPKTWVLKGKGAGPDVILQQLKAAYLRYKVEGKEKDHGFVGKVKIYKCLNNDEPMILTIEGGPPWIVRGN